MGQYIPGVSQRSSDISILLVDLYITKIHSIELSGFFIFYGWNGRIRTYGWGIQSPLPYHLATLQNLHNSIASHFTWWNSSIQLRDCIERTLFCKFIFFWEISPIFLKKIRLHNKPILSNSFEWGICEIFFIFFMPFCIYWWEYFLSLFYSHFYIWYCYINMYFMIWMTLDKRIQLNMSIYILDF